MIQDGNKSMIFINDELVANFYYPDFSPNAYGFFAFNDDGHPFETYVKNVRVLRRSIQEPTVTTVLSDPNGTPVVLEVDGEYQWGNNLDGVTFWALGLDDDGITKEGTTKFVDGNKLIVFEIVDAVNGNETYNRPYTIDENGYIRVTESVYQYYNVVGVEDGAIQIIQDNNGIDSVANNGINKVSMLYFTTRAAAEEYHGDRSGEDWVTYDDIGETTFINYLDGYAPDSIDGFNVRVFEDGETFNTTFSNGMRTDSTGDSALYTYEKTSANEGTITLLFENEANSKPEVTTIKFLSPNNGSFIWREYSNNSLQNVLDQGSGTWEMTPGFERSTYDSSKWDVGYFSGGEPVQSVGSALILSGNSTADIEYPVKMPAELVTAADGDNTGNSFLFVRSDEQITGLEANILLPSSNEMGAGVYIAIWDAYPFESHAIELALKDDGNATIVIDYLDEDGIEQEFVRDDNVSLDTNYSVRITHRLGKTSYFINNDEVVTSYNGATPDFWGFGAFGDENESYNAEISGIKILDKYPVEEYSKTLVETSDGNPVGLLSNENDFSWGLDLNGTTLWSVSPDLSYQRFKYEFKEDDVTRTTINQWEDNETDEILELPYSISEDGVLFIQGTPHGDEYLNLIGIDENGTIAAKYGSNKKESEYQEFTQFSYPIATSDDKAMTLQISDNGEVADTFAIVDENNNTQMIFESITDVIDFLKVQEDNASFQKWVQLTNYPVIDALEYYAVENNTTDYFYTDEDHSIESYKSIAFEEVTQGPLSFKKFKGTIVDGITHYSRNGISKYFITPASDIEPSSITLTTGSRIRIGTIIFHNWQLITVTNSMQRVTL